MEIVYVTIGTLIVVFLFHTQLELGRIRQALEERNKQTFKDDK
jgi:hypothetical protein